MPMTKEQLDNWFIYHKPTPETAPKYTAIRERERACTISVTQAAYENVSQQKLHDVINEECKAFAVLIDQLCPEGDDKKAAIEHVRLARNAFNEGISTGEKPNNMQWYWNIGETELVKARWKANSAIACGGL